MTVDHHVRPEPAQRATCSPAILTALVTVACAFTPALAREFRLGPQSDVNPMLRRIEAGDSIILENGTWTDADLQFEQLCGSTAAPITIRAETAGQVVFTGRTSFRFSGTDIVVSGLTFRDTNGASDVLQMRTHSKRQAHRCRLTDCTFEQTGGAAAGMESRWVSVYGTHNRIDHCYFGGKRSRGTTLVVWVGEQAEHHRIDHNHFGPRPKLGKNGGETIRVGTSETSEFDSATIVEQNYFHRCNGEAEIISNKSCANIYRGNVFEECSGALTLRHGHRCQVTGNVFLGRKKRGTGGVRIIGRSHRVTHNYFEALRGDGARAAISMMNCFPKPRLNGYAHVRDAVVSNNTFVDCKVTIEIGLDASNKQNVAPADCLFWGNVFAPGRWPIFRLHAHPTNFRWTDNLEESNADATARLVQFKQADLNLSRGSDKLLRMPTDDRAKVPAGFNLREQTWPSDTSTGPTWYRNRKAASDDSGDK